MENEAELHKYFDFDETDLAANRLGSLSARQQARDRNDARNTRRFLFIGTGMLVTVAFVPLFVLYFQQADSPRWTLWTILGLVWLTAAAFLFFLGRNISPSVTDTLKSVEGPVCYIQDVKEDGDIKYETFTLTVGGVDFDLPDGAPQRFLPQDEHFTVYYLDQANQILSMEKTPAKQA